MTRIEKTGSRWRFGVGGTRADPQATDEVFAAPVKQVAPLSRLWPRPIPARRLCLLSPRAPRIIDALD